tara:strand:- start:290 stop:1210 length:921 start_codon:yes stop_codon:yes gene_type:complete
MINLFINSEFASLKKVILGVGSDFGGCPTLAEAYDPKSKEHILNGTFPKEDDIKKELIHVVGVFNKYGIDVLRPKNISNCNQIFARDVGFVIEDEFFIANMICKRSQEISGLSAVLEQIDSSKINHIPQDIFIEGGDVIVSEKYLFIGFSSEKKMAKYEVSRTNKKALDFLKQKFPNKEIIGFDLKKSDINSLQNCLHLDCCFQPLGLGHVILYADGFECQQDLDLITNIFGKDNIILIDQEEMSNMCSNVVSISKNIIVSEKKFSRLNSVLRAKGYIVEEVVFSEISKMGGLLRCATLPLIRDYE